MDVDGIIDSELHDEGRKSAAWEKAYNAALDRWVDELTDDERAAVIDDWITNNNGVATLAKWMAKQGSGWSDDVVNAADNIIDAASDTWATEQARKELEDGR